MWDKGQLSAPPGAAGRRCQTHCAKAGSEISVPRVPARTVNYEGPVHGKLSVAERDIAGLGGPRVGLVRVSSASQSPGQHTRKPPNCFWKEGKEEGKQAGERQ